MASSRSKRANAGNKMASLLTSPEIEEDDFYKTLYGGFQEEEGDKDFEEPKEADDSAAAGDDDCDSDFSLDENEEPQADKKSADGTSAEQGKLKRPKKDEAEEAENDKSDEEPKTKRDKVEDAKETEATDT